MSWSKLSGEAKALRLVHIAIAVIGLTSLGYVWLSALTGRRDRFLVMAGTALSLQGVAILLGRGNCPMGPIQERLGDPTPCFELVLPKRAAKAAIPVLVTLTLAGIAAIATRYARSAGRPPSDPGLGR